MSKETRPVLVLGGGVAGLTAASALAAGRVPVVLVERAGDLGGHGRLWPCMATSTCQKCSACLVEDARKAVTESRLVEIFTSWRVDKCICGDSGFRVEAVPVESSRAGTEAGPARCEAGRLPSLERRSWNVDAVFVATGFRPFPAEKKPMLGYGKIPQVLTTLDLDFLVKQERIRSPWPGADGNRRVAFLQCVGSRDREAGRDYCSQVCCKTSLRLANKLLADRPDLEITVFYIDLQIHGKGFRQVFDDLKERIRFVQGVPSEVLPSEPDGAALVYEDPASGVLKTESFGAVVLAVGMVPDEEAGEVASLLGLARGMGGFFTVPEGMTDRIYLIGACLAPTDIAGARRQALSAVASYLASRGLR